MPNEIHKNADSNNKKLNDPELEVKIIKRAKAILAKIETKKENLSLKNSQLETPAIKATKPNKKDEGKKIIALNITITIIKALINL